MAISETTNRKVQHLAGNFGLDTADVIDALDGVDVEDPEAIFDALTGVTTGQWERPRYSPASVEAFADAFVALDDTPHVGASDETP